MYRSHFQQALLDLRQLPVAGEDHFLEVVGKGLPGGGITCDQLVKGRWWRKALPGSELTVGPSCIHIEGRDHQDDSIGQLVLQGREQLADALAQLQAAADEEGHVGAQSRRQLLQLPGRHPGLPQLVQSPQDRRGVTGAAPQSGPCRYAFLQPDMHALISAGIFLEQLGGPQAEVALVNGNPSSGGAGDFKCYFNVGLAGQGQLVAEVDLLEEGVKQVIAVIAAADDAQAKVDLGVGGESEGHWRGLSQKRGRP